MTALLVNKKLVSGLVLHDDAAATANLNKALSAPLRGKADPEGPGLGQDHLKYPLVIPLTGRVPRTQQGFLLQALFLFK